eukprot:Opistho-2@37160
MAKLIPRSWTESLYRDTKFRGNEDEQENKLRESVTMYVGNLSFYTKEEQIYELFSKCGEIKRIIMGLDRFKKTPCGFCFVEYYTRPESEFCMKYVNGTVLDDRVIRTDWDAGFVEGRQFGRGRSGGQVRDEFRSEFDEGRGGFGRSYGAETAADPHLFNPAMYNPTAVRRPRQHDGGRKRYQDDRHEDEGNSAKRRRESMPEDTHEQAIDAADKDKDKEKEKESKNPRFDRQRDSDDEDA